jgi:hypothetical protein
MALAENVMNTLPLRMSTAGPSFTSYLRFSHSNSGRVSIVTLPVRVVGELICAM